MSLIRNSLPLILSIGVLAGCASAPPEEQTSKPSPTSPAAATKAAQMKMKKGLPAQELQPGECGLFLWTRRESPEFVFFSKAGEETALFWMEGNALTLQRTGVAGTVFGQELTEQFFALPDGRTMELRMEPGDLLVSGQRVPEASIRVRDDNGWETLIPVAGVTGCQPDA